MKWINLATLIGLFVLLSCNHEKPSIRPTTVEKQWMQPLFWLDDYQNLYNFPFWFDEDLIREHHVKVIEMKEEFSSNGQSEEDQWNSLKTWKMFFDSTGQIQKMKIYETKDARIIYQKIINYQENDSTLNFKNFLLSEKSLLDSAFQINDRSNYSILKENNHYLQFQYSDKSRNIYFIKDSSLLNPISIDTMLSPESSDLIVYPNLKRPQKIYSVDNVIIETPVTNVFYNKNNALDSIHIRIKSNKIRKVFSYNEKGYLNGYTIDVVDHDRIIRTDTYTIHLDALNRPIKIENKDSKNTSIIHLKYYSENQ